MSGEDDWTEVQSFWTHECLLWVFRAEQRQRCRHSQRDWIDL